MPARLYTRRRRKIYRGRSERIQGHGAPRPYGTLSLLLKIKGVAQVRAIQVTDNSFQPLEIGYCKAHFPGWDGSGFLSGSQDIRDLQGVRGNRNELENTFCRCRENGDLLLFFYRGGREFPMNLNRIFPLKFEFFQLKTVLAMQGDASSAEQSYAALIQRGWFAAG